MGAKQCGILRSVSGEGRINSRCDAGVTCIESCNGGSQQPITVWMEGSHVLKEYGVQDNDGGGECESCVTEQSFLPPGKHGMDICKGFGRPNRDDGRTTVTMVSRCCLSSRRVPGETSSNDENHLPCL
jgi:hypothetical protein